MQDEFIQELRRKEEEELAKTLSGKYKIPYLDLSRTSVEIDSLKIVPEKTARDNSMAVVQGVGKKLQIAVTNPNRKGLKEVLENLKRNKYEVQLFLVSASSLNKALDKYKEIPKFEAMVSGLIDISKSKLEEYTKAFSNTASIKKKLDEFTEQKEARKASDSLELILAGAIAVDASDIHIEPTQKGAKLRLRLDGVLQDLTEITAQFYNLLLSRIKLLSEIKLNIHDRPQDGRFTIKTKTEEIEVRTSLLPGPYGESVVMRLLLPKTIELKFENLGVQPALYKILEKELKRPNGMILTTGPTGSGKTTTLYSFLKKISSSKIKMITIEDPIEYHLSNVTQTQVDKERGYDFSNGLRSILRQDPDVILVGEIRDFETAEIAMHAALTGHLVFSTLHTNNAAGTIPRLIDLGIRPNIIPPAINVAMAQRLVRKLCEYCKSEVEPTTEEKKFIENNINSMPEEYKVKPPKNYKIWRAGSCEKCNHTGYKGRRGIFEAFLIDDDMERLIVQSPPEADIKDAAVRQGMLTMLQDGILKILTGITSFEELNRVVSEE